MTAPFDLLVDFAPGAGPFDVINGGAWVDVSDRLLHADWEIGRGDEFEDFPAGEATLVLKNDDRLFDPDYTAGTYFGQLLPRVPFRIRSVLPALDLPGGGSSSATTPDHADFAITDLDVSIRLALDDWTPAATTILVGQNGIFSQVGWSLSITTGGLLSLSWSPDGTAGAVLSRNTTAAPGFVNGSDHTLRVTLDVNDGAGNRVVTFYVDGDVFETFTTAGTTTIFNSNQPLTISIAASVAGTVRDMQLLGSIGGSQIASPDFMIQWPGTTSFVDQTTRTWTINGTGSIAIDTTTPFDEFYGFVDGGWEQDLEPPKLANCTVKLTDRLGILAGYKLPDVFHQAILDLDPVGFWVLDGGGTDSAERVADQGSGHNDGSLYGEGVTLGDKVITPGHRPAARFDSEIDEAVDKRRYGSVSLGRSSIIDNAYTSALLVATFQARSKPTDDRRILFVQATGTNVDAWTDRGGFEAHIHTDGRLIYGSQTILTGASPKTVVDGLPHIVFANNESLGVDTATLTGSGTVSKSISTVTGAGIGGQQGLKYTRHWDGWIGVVAIYASSATVGTAGRDAILAAYSKLDGQRSGAHIAWALDQLGIPAEHRNIAEGTIIMGPADAGGQDALGWIRNVVSTEQGAFYVDHRDGGKLRFTDRYHRFLEDRSTIAQEQFSDSPTSGITVVRVERDQLDVAPNGTDSIINQVTAKWRDGEEIIEDAASVASYGPQSHQIDTEATTAGQARSAAEWIVARYAQPRSRVRGVGIHPGGARRGLRTVHALEIHDRVTHRLHPQQIGSASTVTLFVEGVRHEVDDIDWRTRYQLSPAETFAPWVWGVSEWGTETYWG